MFCRISAAHRPLQLLFARRALAQQPHRYLVVVDFEATCDSNVAFETYPHEIIEFPAVVVDTAKDFAIVGEFRSLVRPKRNPILSSFCTTLTSITQSEINHASPFPAVMRNFHAFLQSHKLLPADLAFERACAMRDDEMPALPYIMPPSPDVFFNEWKSASNAASQASGDASRSVALAPTPTTPTVVIASADGGKPAQTAAENPPPPQQTPLAPFALVTDGPTDFRRFLASDCKHNDMQIPFYFRYEMREHDLPISLHFSKTQVQCAFSYRPRRRWITLKPHFRGKHGGRRITLASMLSRYRLAFQGREHRGADDARNIARVAIELARQDSVVLTCNDAISATFAPVIATAFPMPPRPTIQPVSAVPLPPPAASAPSTARQPAGDGINSPLT